MSLTYIRKSISVPYYKSTIVFEAGALMVVVVVVVVVVVAMAV